MMYKYSAEQKLLQEQIAETAKLYLNHDIIAKDKASQFDRTAWQHLSATGIMGLLVPEAYGGSALTAFDFAIALEALGNYCEDSGLTFAFAAHSLACVLPIVKFADEHAKQTFLPKLADGSWIAANAMTETQSGSDAFNMKSRIDNTESESRLYASKCFVSNGPVADLVVLYASADPSKGFFGGVSGFLLRKDADQFKVGQIYDKMGLRTCPISEILVDGVAIDAGSRLGKEGAGGQIFNTSMEWERALLPAMHVGIMERLVRQTIQYTKNRESGGVAISKLQAVSHHIADMKVCLEASRALVYNAAQAIDSQKFFGLQASVVKVFVSEQLKKVCDMAVQLHGGYGFTTDYQVERALRDAQSASIYSGTSDIMKNMIGAHLGL